VSFVGATLDAADLTRAVVSPTTDFAGAGLIATKLVGIDFCGGVDPCVTEDFRKMGLVDLSRSDLTSSILKGLDFSLLNTKFHELDAEESSILASADLTGASFQELDVGGVVFSSADLTDANLFLADLSEAKFDRVTALGVNSYGANFRAVDLSGSDFSPSNPSDVDCISDLAILTNVSGCRSDFTNASFAEARFAAEDVELLENGVCPDMPDDQKVNLKGAMLEGANLTGAILFAEGCVLIDSTTTYSLQTYLPSEIRADFRKIMTIVPEPGQGVLQLASLLVLQGLIRRRARRV
jgi:uncharacterized protein YjbI with pentapeptide repeats